MYKPVTSLVNGEIIKDLLDLCNDNFINPFVQLYAGGGAQCMFCGATNSSHHLVKDCPVIKYQDIVNKHKRFVVKK